MVKHEITVEADKDLVIFSLSGFWQRVDFEKSIQDTPAALSQLRCRIGNHLLLCDLTKLDVIAPDIANEFSSVLNGQASHDSKWMAIAVHSTLLRLQIQRLLTRGNARIFDNVHDARTWLLTSSGRLPASEM